METQLLSHNSSGEINLLNRNSTDNIRLSAYDEQQLLEHQEMILKQQLIHNQQKQKALQQHRQEQQQRQEMERQQKQQQQLLLNENLSDEENLKKGITRTSFFVGASRAILTNKFISFMAKQLNSSQDFNNVNKSKSNINFTNNNNKEIENISKLIENGFYVQGLIPESDYSFLCDQLCIYDPYAIFFLNTDESKQILMDSFQLCYSISPQQQYFNNNNTCNNNNNNQQIITYKDFVMKSHPIQSWLEFQQRKSITSVGFRTKYIDQVIMESLSLKGTIANFNASAFFYTQVVFCGSGLDSRSLRLPIDKHVSVFEVDLPNVIEFKKRILENATKVIKPTSQCRINYIGGDIVKEGDRWIGGLIDSGFNPAMHTLWVLEGVLMYLTEEEIGTLLGAIGMLSAPNSKLLIHTVSPSSNNNNNNNNNNINNNKNNFKNSTSGIGASNNSSSGNINIYNNNNNPQSSFSPSSSSPSLSSSSSSSSSSTTNNINLSKSKTYSFFKDEFISFHSNPIELLKEFGFSKDITSVSYSDLNQLYQCDNTDFIDGNGDYSKFTTGIFLG